MEDHSTSSFPCYSTLEIPSVVLGGSRVNGTLHDVPGLQLLDPEEFTNAEVPNLCSLHELPVPNINSYNTKTRTLQQIFTKSPLKPVRGVKQYLYDEKDVEYLDCVNGTAHVGHCHPQVVSAGHMQMTKLATAQGFVSDILSKYVKELVSSLPDPLSVCYLCNSGSEANDLALRLCTQYTGREDILSVEDGYYGNFKSLISISPKMHNKVPNFKKPEWAHHIPLPDTFRINSAEQWDDYVRQFEEKLADLERRGRPIAAFIFESLFTVPGLYHPPAPVIKAIIKAVRSHGGLIIVDEVQTGLGRTGEYMWGFMNYEIVPDIVTVGKPLGNGHPMGAVLCSLKISSKLGSYFSTFGGNPVACAIGMSVLDVIKNEKLMSSARMVGKYLKTQFKKLTESHDILGDTRGLGLVHALEIVKSKSNNLPAPQLTTQVMYGLRSRNILVAITGINKNIILFTPPMCFNMENSRRFVTSLGEVLRTVEARVESLTRAEDLKRRSIGGEEEDAGGSIGGDVAGAKRLRLSVSENQDGYEDMD